MPVSPSVKSLHGFTYQPLPAGNAFEEWMNGINGHQENTGLVAKLLVRHFANGQFDYCAGLSPF